jgi:hypothetical protein
LFVRKIRYFEEISLVFLAAWSIECSEWNLNLWLYFQLSSTSSQLLSINFASLLLFRCITLLTIVLTLTILLAVILTLNLIVNYKLMAILFLIVVFTIANLFPSLSILVLLDFLQLSFKQFAFQHFFLISPF